MATNYSNYTNPLSLRRIKVPSQANELCFVLIRVIRVVFLLPFVLSAKSG